MINVIISNVDTYNTWYESFIGNRYYLFSFGKLNNGYLRSNQIQIPWTSDDVFVALLRINIPGMNTMRIDYKTANITKQGRLYIQYSTNGAVDSDKIAGCVAECDIRITKK